MTRRALIRSAMLATTALAPFAAVPAIANPQGPNVVGGQATVSGVGTSSVTVNQATNRAIINWHSFNIGAGERTRFNQPGADSVALNRVTGGLGPSQLYGTLSANGRVYVVNPDGILIGRGAVIDTAGFLATTHDITNENFMAGRYHFNRPGRPDASVVNEGTINAHSHGFAALVAPGVRNSGTITATYGKIGLAAGNSFSLDFYGDKLISLAVGDSIAATVKDVATGKPLNALVKNDGKLSANGGRVELTAASARAVVDSVINNTGVIEARSIGTRNGKIVLGGPTANTKVAGAPAQTVKVSGKLDVSNAGGKGGTIQVTGEKIVIQAASFDASGTTGGGKVLIGGDTGGGHGHWAVESIPQAALEPGGVPNATTVEIDAATTINASATSVGDGGKVIVWADGATSFAGTILGRGGEYGGNGGFAEVSGKVTLGYFGTADMRAPYGTFGTLLLDPYNITISLAATSGGSLSGGTFTPTATSNINNTDLVGWLGLASVIITTGGLGSAGGDAGNITVSAPVVWNTNATLTLAAYNNIIINDTGDPLGNIRNESLAAGNLVLRAGLGNPSGTVVMPNSTNSVRVNWTLSTGHVTVYYNPASGLYTAPTDFNVNDGNPPSGKFNVPSSQLTQYMLVNSFANLADIGTDAFTLNQKYALGRDIGGPFTGIPGIFTGVFDGKNPVDGSNYTLSGTLTGPAVFGVNSGTIKNLNLNVNVTAGPSDQFIAALAGTNSSLGTIENVHVVGGTINGLARAGIVAGGLVGRNAGDIFESSSLAAVSVGPNGVGGGLVGINTLTGFISNAEATGNVTGAAGAPGSPTILGGLAGRNEGEIYDSQAGGNVGSPGVNYLRAGGFVGDNFGMIESAQATGNVFAGNFSEAGGFMGASRSEGCTFIVGDCGSVEISTASGDVTVGSSSVAGGFAGKASLLWDVHATGNVTGGGDSILGGLVGINELTSFTLPSNVTLLPGFNLPAGGGTIPGVILSSTASGSVTSTGPNSWVGGLVGYNGGFVLDSSASGAATGTSDSFVGGFAGLNVGTIAFSTASGAATATGSNSVVGGFAGVNFGTIVESSSSGAATGGASNVVGGFVGANASYINFDPGIIAFSTFPFGQIVNSTGSGAASGGPGSTVGSQVGVNNPSSLPNHPALIANCSGTLCEIIRTGILGGAQDRPRVPDEVLAMPNLVALLGRLERFQPTDALIRIIQTNLTTPGGQPGSGRPGSQVPGTPPRSLAPPPAYIRSNGLPSGLPPINETRFNPSQVIVQFPSNVTQAEWNRIAQQFGLTIVSSSQTAGGVAVQFQLGSGQNVRNMIRALEQLRELGTVQPNYTYALVQKPTEPAAAAAPVAATAHRGDPAQYMTGKLRLNEAHKVSSGSNVSVAVIDSEVDPEHAELVGTFAGRFDATQSEARPHSHGTAMAGAIVSRDRLLGVAPGARIMAVRAFSETQTSAESTTFTILKGIEWAVSQGARVINMSFAGPYDPSLEKALKDAADKGVILIGASGNAGPKSPPLWPGADPNVIAVTATDSGDKLFRQANRGPYVSVASPGVEILAPAPQAGYQMSTGTSIATAHVSGVVALMLERDPTLTPRDVRLILESTATDLGAKGRDTQYGWGLVNASRALTMVDERVRNRKTSAAPTQR